MLSTVGSALIYLERRRLVQVFPESVRKLWEEWELRMLLLASLILQITLVMLGHRRKWMGKPAIRVIIWSAYLLADWVSTVSLGAISRTVQQKVNGNCRFDGNDLDMHLMCFWAPFLLLHLGGPDTITAYSLEDNELWLRHLFGFVGQASVAFYIFLLSLPRLWTSILSIPILAAGLIKCWERTWALRLANNHHFRDSMLRDPDPGPNYAKFMAEYTSKKAEGYHVRADEVIEPQVHVGNSYPAGRGKLINEAYDQFQTFKRLFADLILSFQDKDNSRPYFMQLSSENAFHVVEIELGFAFDALYTKAQVVYNRKGFILRAITFFLTCIALLGFVFLCDMAKYSKVDLVITFLMLVVALLLEIYSVGVMLKSDWTDRWLGIHNMTRESIIIPGLQRPRDKCWSRSMAQYNLLSVCLREQPAVFHRMQKYLHFDDFLEKLRNTTYNKVSTDLKTLIYGQFKMFANDENYENSNKIWSHRGSFTIQTYPACQIGAKRDSFLLQMFTELEFDQKILIFHVATDLCYHWDGGSAPANVSVKCRESKNISDYMLYLLVMCPFMLPMGIGMIRFRDTCAEATEFFQDKGPVDGKADACRKLHQVNTEILPRQVKGDRSKSVLFDACKLAKLLQAMEMDKKWEFVSHLWVEMLAYAAMQCRGHHHARQLRKGGELLTHVWLLMAHLGITEQFQINHGHARAKLTTK